MPDDQGWKIGGVEIPAAAPAAANIGGGWTISSAPAQAAVIPAAPVPAPAPPNGNAIQPEAGGFAPGPAKPPAVPMEYDDWGKRDDPEFAKQEIPGMFGHDSPALNASQAIGGGWRLIQAVAPNIGYTALRGMGKPEKDLGPPPTIDARAAMNAASDVVEGAGNLVAPAALPLGLAAAPVETGLSLAGMYGASKGASAATEALGGSPEASRFAGDVAGALVAGGGGKLAIDKMYEAAGSPEVRFGKFPAPKPFADMSDAELIGHANAIERDPPKNYEWQKEEIAKEVINRQNARALPGAAPQAPADDLGNGWSLVRAKAAARSEDVRGNAAPVVTPAVTPPAAAAPPVVTPPDVTPVVTPAVTPPAAAAPPVVTPPDVTPVVTPAVTPPAAAAPPPAAAQPAAGPAAQQEVPAAEAPAAAAEPPKPASNTAEVYTINGRKVNVRYEAREDGDLTNSFQAGYPQEYQPRDTDRLSSAQRVAQRKGDMNGALMADSRLASDGAPVILDDGTVITRNHGTQALRELYDANSSRAQDYKQWVTDHAGEFGLDPAKVAGMNKPVLTRVLTDPMKPADVADFAREANMSSAARMSDAEVAQSLSKRMTGPLMDSFDPAEDGTPNAPFVRELIKGLPVEEQGVFMDAKGHLSQTGARIVRNTIFAKAYPDQRALERMSESENASLKNITGGMLRAAPKVAQFQEAVSRGDRFDLGIGPEIADAAAALDGIARSKSTLADWKAQGDMFGRDPVVSRLVDLFAENRRSGKRIGDVLREYTEVANDAGDPKQDSMFGPPETPNKAEILEIAYERARERWSPAQKDLFGDDAAPTAAGGDGLAAQEGPGTGSDERGSGALESRRVTGEPPAAQQSFLAPEAEAESRATAQNGADRLLGEQLTAQIKSGGAVKSPKPRPAQNRGLFDEEGPEQGALFAKRIGGPAWRRGMSRKDLAAEAQMMRGHTGDEQYPALHVNAQAMDLMRRGAGENALGSTFTPSRMARVSRDLLAEADASPDRAHAGNLRAAAWALDRHARETGDRPSIVLQRGPGVSDAEYEAAAREELNHAKQLQATGGEYGNHVDAEKFLSSPEGQKAVLALRKGYGQAGYPELALEAGARLMEPGRHAELGLRPEEAVALARRYREHLIDRHGAEKVAEVIGRVDNAFKQFREAQAHNETGVGDRQPQPQKDAQGSPGAGAGGGGRGVPPSDGLSRSLFGPDDPGVPLDSRRIARDESREAVQKALADQEDKNFGAKLRTYVTGERDVRIAETNQSRDDLQRLLPDPKDQEALTLMRDFKHRPGEMAEFVSGSHQAFRGMDSEDRAAAVADIRKLEPIIARAQDPTPAMKAADAELTNYYAAHLKEGQELGFLASTLNNDEYITHIGLGQAMEVQRPGLLQRMLDFGGKGSGPGVGPRGFKFAKKRDVPTVLHAVAYGIPPRTLNALDAMTIYGDQFARTASAHLMMRELDAGGAAGWASFGGQRRGEVPRDWKEIAPDSPTFRKEVSWREQAGEPEETQNYAEKHYFAPAKVVDALAPIFSRNDMDRVPFFMTARVYQSYIKSVELGMSVFHVKALNLTGLNNMGPSGVLAAYQTDMASPGFEGQERAMVRAGGTSPVLGRTMEAYHALTPKSLPSGPDAIRNLPAIRQVDRLAQGISEFTFGTVQRKLKVTDFSLQDAAWLAKHPAATGAEHFEAQRNIARQVNAAYGGLNWENLGVHRISLELSRALLLAPDWTYSNILNVGQSFEGGAAGSASRLFWVRSLMVGVALTEGMSLLLGGRASKDPTQVNMGVDRNGGAVHQNLFFAGAPGDAVTLVNNVEKYGAVYGVARSIFNKFGPIAKTAVDLHDTRAGVKKGAGLLGKTWAGMKRGGEDLAPVPFAIPAIARMLRDPRGQYSMQDYVSTALTGQTPTHGTPPKPSAEMRRLMGRTK